jgi:hypothetical protein
MNKILINNTYGGYDGSWPRAAILALHKRYPETISRIQDYQDPKYVEDSGYEPMDYITVFFNYDELVGRHDPRLIEIAEEFKFNDDDSHSLVIEEIEGDEYEIREHDGMEWIVQPQLMEWVKIEKADTFQHLKSCADDEL